MPRTGPAGQARSEARRVELLHAAALTLVDRGYGDTRIAEVAARANVSTALLIYYFGTREQMLVESLRLAESNFYAEADTQMRNAHSAFDRLERLVSICLMEDEQGRTLRGLWLEYWSQAQRHPDVARSRAAHDAQWRDLIAHVVREGQFNGEVDSSVDARTFAMALAGLLDGLSVQVGLDDPEVRPPVAYALAMDFISSRLSNPANQGPRVWSRCRRRRVRFALQQNPCRPRRPRAGNAKAENAQNTPQADLTRARLLEAATRAFAEKGFHGTTTPASISREERWAP